MNRGDIDYREHIDPEYQRWGRIYPSFPGVVECARLIREGKARGAWADIIAAELARHAAFNLSELLDIFRSDSSESVRLFVMMAIEMAHLPETVPFLATVLLEGNPLFAPYAVRGLRALDTLEARTALREIKNSS
jgi:hypothetical protein